MPTKKPSTAKSQKGSLKNNIANMEEIKLRELVVFGEAEPWVPLKEKLIREGS